MTCRYISQGAGGNLEKSGSHTCARVCAQARARTKPSPLIMSTACTDKGKDHGRSIGMDAVDRTALTAGDRLHADPVPTICAMSANWASGSSPRWRATRLEVLARDGYRCTLRLEGCQGRADQGHHVLGRAITGDDPRYVVAACGPCNSRTGDPMRLPDPPHVPVTRW